MLAEMYHNLSPVVQTGIVISTWSVLLVAIPIVIHKIREKSE